jgi:digeranylgeranylglycerophospholipid reductase
MRPRGKTTTPAPAIRTSAFRREGLAVVGGGPAGLSAALAAARNGRPCVLFERGRIGAGIRCAEGIFDPAGILPMDKAFIRTRIRAATLRVGGFEATFRVGARNRFFIIDRSEWQSEVGRQIRDMGVEIREGCPARPEELVGDFAAVIDARGTAAYTADGWKERSTPPGFAVQWTLAGDFSRWRDTILVDIHEPQPGYFWIFPKGERAANVGFGWYRLPAGVSPLGELEAYLRRYGLDEYERIRKIGGFLAGTFPPRYHTDGIYRAGDAGGFASALHGGGIDAAWLTGRLAVEAHLKGDPAHVVREANRKLGFLRHVEQRVLDKWLAEGPAALERAGRLLQENGPMLRASVRFVTSGVIGAAVRRVFQQTLPTDFYHPA